MDQYFRAAVRLHQYLVATHWSGQGLLGPDPGIRFNYRIGRFLKSYLGSIRWHDAYYYLQAQGYWILANWCLLARTGEESYRNIALRCSEYMLSQQRDDGAWDYPNPEWKGRVATGEGSWGSLGLVESYRQTADPMFLTGALHWHKFLIETIGFQQVGEQLAVNYFANRRSLRVPNNSANVLRLLAELAEVTGRKDYLLPYAGLLNFLRGTQKATGEFPYAVEGVAGGKGRPHFQCYQYNAFQCLELIRCYEITGDVALLRLITGVLGFLRQGLSGDGHAFYACGNRHRAVTYHTAALAAAFVKAAQLGLHGYDGLANSAYAHLLALQRPDGGFSYSQRDYRLLSDRRSYPRYLAMILYHLLLRHPAIEKDVARQEKAQDDAC
jgi:hypothetical protein